MGHLKAWEVIGWTYKGEVYCPECNSYNDPTVTGESAVDNRIDKPAPIFASDEVPDDWTCTVCSFHI